MRNKKNVKLNRVQSFTLEFTVGEKMLYANFGGNTNDIVFSPPAPPNSSNSTLSGTEPAMHAAFYDSMENYFTIVKNPLVNSDNLLIKIQGGNGTLNVVSVPTGITVTGTGPYTTTDGVVEISITVSNDSSNMMGDLNGDGTVNIFDVLALVQISIGNVNPTEYQLEVGDLNGDNDINIFDVLALVQLSIGNV
jgi:hypothetical protein